MLLAIDAGNTNVVFALFDGAELRAQWRCATDRRRTADEYAVWLLQLMALKGFDPAAVTGAILASVVPDATFNLRGLVRHHFGCEPLTVGDPDVALGIPVRLDRPQEVGADRLVNAVAAHAAYGGPLIVVDFGTATTFDVVAEDGGYCGGAIAPGINLSMEALHMAAAKLPRIAVEPPPSPLGSSTVHAMQSGIFWGYVGLIEGLVSRLRGAFLGEAAAAAAPERMRAIGTGGLAVKFAGATPAINVVDRDLTLRGLQLIHRRNRPDAHIS